MDPPVPVLFYSDLVKVFQDLPENDWLLPYIPAIWKKKQFITKYWIDRHILGTM